MQQAEVVHRHRLAMAALTRQAHFDRAAAGGSCARIACDVAVGHRALVGATTTRRAERETALRPQRHLDLQHALRQADGRRTVEGTVRLGVRAAQAGGQQPGSGRNRLVSGQLRPGYAPQRRISSTTGTPNSFRMAWIALALRFDQALRSAASIRARHSARPCHLVVELHAGLGLQRHHGQLQAAFHALGEVAGDRTPDDGRVELAGGEVLLDDLARVLGSGSGFMIGYGTPWSTRPCLAEPVGGGANGRRCRCAVRFELFARSASESRRRVLHAVERLALREHQRVGRAVVWAW